MGNFWRLEHAGCLRLSLTALKSSKTTKKANSIRNELTAKTTYCLAVLSTLSGFALAAPWRRAGLDGPLDVCKGQQIVPFEMPQPHDTVATSLSQSFRGQISAWSDLNKSWNVFANT
ncbi:hypothetical protein Ae201684P_007123 [Aphanomyces euteiches]|uniref:Uncharacterized protein n=1 Tax=Aphanomyces euteiches TaxID=100861 RepID=A0A6G0WR25_9STRA|nr:hypothetical protein Ae201684_012617 [Aphanomyces euteiches]KAH9100932.1 hypothetical protein Ae201684P_007123 [Aphanomyces euteiches]